MPPYVAHAVPRRIRALQALLLGGHATPLHFLKMPLQYADHALDVWHRVASRVQKTYGLSSKSNATSFTYSSSAGAIKELIDVTEGP